jgi:putative endonuclease
MAKMNRRRQGQAGEELAAQYLEKAGFKILERNYRFERGEIDLIAEDGDDLVFIEVKARHSNKYGEPEDAVTEEKQEQVHNVAEGYIYEREIENRECRFDVVAIEYRSGQTEIRHIKDAF